MAIQNDNTVLNKGDLKAYHEKILPYLGGNMMMQTGVSDYYSTDEKVVGIWTDGKPIYQKTIYSTLPDATTEKTLVTKTVSVGAQIDKVARYEAYFKNANSYVFAIDCVRIGVSDGGTIDHWTSVDVTENANPHYPNVIRFMNSRVANNGLTCWCTVQYTKTTDTATSALTTPGAYDLNRPDLWPANKEIFFGNGLYGQRFTGTITAAKNAPDNTVIMTGLQNGSIINWGGNWIDADGNQMGAGSYKGDTVQSLIQLNKTNFNGQLYFSTNDNTGARTNAPYDIWVTYTK